MLHSIYTAMKKIIYLILAGLAICACESTMKKGKELTPDEQKNKLEVTAQTLMDEMPAEDFDEFSDLASFLNDTYFSKTDFDFSEFGNRYEELYNDFLTEDINGAYLTLVLSQCTGEFSFGDNSITYKDSEKLSLSITDDNGDNWVTELQTSGKTNTIANNDFNVTLKIPEQIGVVVTKNGKTVVSVTVTYDLDLSSNINPSKDKAEITEKVIIKDYEIYHNSKFNARTGNASVSATVTKNGKNLLNYSATGEVSLSGGNIDEAEFKTVSNAKISADILGSVQIQGTLDDYLEIMKILDEPGIVGSYEAAIKKANSMMDVSVRYDGTSTVQAKIELEYQYHREVDGQYEYEHYSIIPVIVFNDGSRYNVEDYFSEDRFSDLIDMFGNFLEMYKNLIERIG